MTHARFLLHLLAFSAACIPCATAQADATSTRADELRSMIEEAVAAKESVGMSVAVMRGGEWLIAGGFGIAELEHGVSADVATVFRIGSITKQFTAAAVMRLVEQGKVELDADFRDYLPEYPEPSATVTVRHLLTHTSGIPSYTGLPAWRPKVPLELSHDELLALFEDLDLEFTPGTDFKYNNSGYYLLGVLIEEVTGESYAEHLRKTLFEPLGLTRTRYDSNQDLIPNRAQGYRLVGGELANDAPIGMSQPGGAGGLLSTAKELVRWARALANGEVVSAESYRQMTTAYRLADGRDRGYGFGLRVREVEGQPCVSHGGGIHGFNSNLAHFPRQDLTIAVISNCEAWRAGRLANAIARELLAASEPVAAEPAADATEVTLRAPAPLGDLPVTHRVPADWTAEKPESSMRMAQFRTAPGSEHPCIVYFFGTGGGGGERANLGRWTKQFADGAKVESETIAIADRIRASVLDVEGTYVAEVRPGSGERREEAGWTMLAAYVDVPRGPLYLKLVGPSSEIGPQRAKFAAWIRSFRAR